MVVTRKRKSLEAAKAIVPTTSPQTTLLSLSLDILQKILIFVPAKSLARLRCVSKFFCSFIVDPTFYFYLVSDPHFIQSHRNLDAVGSTLFLSFPSPLLSGMSRFRRPATFYTIDLRFKSGRALEARRVGFMDKDRFHHVGLQSYAAGMICMGNVRGDVAVCHLCTGQHVSLPKIWCGPQKTVLPLMGFDLVNKKYKVLKLVRYDDVTNKTVTWRHWVMTLGQDESWRKIVFGRFYPYSSLCSYYPYKYNVHLNGVIYSVNWLFKIDHPNPKNQTRFKSVAFEVQSESFSTLPFPTELESGQRYSLLVVDRKLAVVYVKSNFVDRDNVLNNLFVWTLEESMEWEKYETQVPFYRKGLYIESDILRISATRSGEIVLLMPKRKTVLVLSDKFTSKIWKKYQIVGLDEFPVRCVSKQTVMQAIVDDDECASLIP